MTTMTIDDATTYMNKLIATELNGPNELGPAMQRIEDKYGIPYWSQDYIRKGKAKKCDGGLLQRIRNAYLDRCEKQLRHFQNEIKIEKAIGNDPDADLLDEVETLLAKIEARRG